MQTTDEQRALKLSIAVTVLLGLLGVLSGLVTRSAAIIFDGIYSFVDVVLTFASLSVSKLLASEGSRRFQFGYWHLEPMVTALGGSILAIACLYAALNAIRDLLAGGHDVAYGAGAVWAGLLCAVGVAMTAYTRTRASRLDSSLLALDASSWMVSAFLSFALLVGFVVAIALHETSFEAWVPYVDSILLLALALAMLPVPLALTARALREVLLVAPDDLDEQVHGLMNALIRERSFLDYSSQVAKIGRTRMVEIHVLVAPETRIDIAMADAIRREVAARLGASWPAFWLTVDFTSDRDWL